MRIAVIAPSCPIRPGAADAAGRLAAERGGVELVVHPQCFLSNGHFAGSDEERLAAVREVMADPRVDAVWFARGGYGSNRIAEAAAADLPAGAKDKLYLGYSDGGFLLAALDEAGCRVAHGPMVSDVLRPGGEAAARRVIDWFASGGRDEAAMEGGLEGPALAFNLVVLSCLLGTSLEPDFADRELLIEEVEEEHYSMDRLMFHVTSSEAVRKSSGIRLGRCYIRENDRPFGVEEEEIVRHWCGWSGIAYRGLADIGHDADNKVVPFF